MQTIIILTLFILQES